MMEKTFEDRKRELYEILGKAEKLAAEYAEDENLLEDERVWFDDWSCEINEQIHWAENT